jgi:hypothetical protein
VLVGKERTVARRVRDILLATLGVTLAGIFAAWLGGLVGLWDWPPRASSGFGVALGLAGGLIVLFEMALVGRKWLRGRRLGAAKVWMKLHVWLGLACLPVILVHTGFASGGPLTTVTLVLFLLVTASGVWGLVMQQWLPQKMLAEVPGETIAAQTDEAMKWHAAEAARLVRGLVETPPEYDERLASGMTSTESGTTLGPVVKGSPASVLSGFADRVLIPYLETGPRRRSPLASRAETSRRFALLRDSLPVAAHPSLVRLEELCDLRRRWDGLRVLNAWLHNWLVVHLPLSVAMTVLMLLHAVRALKYW